MKKLLIITSFLLLALWVTAQKDSSFVLVKSYQGDVMTAAIDNLDNLYILSSKGQLKKYNAAGDSVAVYNQVRHSGKPATLDISNPLRPLLFYKDYSSVVILDRLLATRSSLDLRKYNILQPTAIGLSYDNNIWVFDGYDNKLKKIDEQGNTLLETVDFRTIFPQPIAPQSIINDNGMVYLADSASGVLVFDNYGTFKKKIPLTGWQSVTVKGPFVIQTTAQGIIIFNTTTYTDTTHPFPPSFQPYVHLMSGTYKLLNLSGESLHIYQLRF